jgi:hypothetical protein
MTPLLDPDAIEALGRNLIALASSLRGQRLAGHPADPPFDADASPRPTASNGPPTWLEEAAAGYEGKPVRMQGTAKQVAWAESLRSTRLAGCRRRAPGLVPVLSIVRDATWWIANDKVSLDELAWPAPEQVEMPRHAASL